MARGKPPSASIPHNHCGAFWQSPAPSRALSPVIPGCRPLFSSLSRKSKYMSWSHFPSSAPHPALPAFRRPAPRTRQETLELPPIYPPCTPQSPPSSSVGRGLKEALELSCWTCMNTATSPQSSPQAPHTLPSARHDSGHRMAPPEMPEHAACFRWPQRALKVMGRALA